MAIKITRIELAAEVEAYNHLETNAPQVLEAIEADYRDGHTADEIASIWRRLTGQGPMSNMVKLAARCVERG